MITPKFVLQYQHYVTVVAPENSTCIRFNVLQGSGTRVGANPKSIANRIIIWVGDEPGVVGSPLSENKNHRS